MFLTFYLGSRADLTSTAEVDVESRSAAFRTQLSWDAALYEVDFFRSGVDPVLCPISFDFPDSRSLAEQECRVIVIPSEPDCESEPGSESTSDDAYVRFRPFDTLVLSVVLYVPVHLFAHLKGIKEMAQELTIKVPDAHPFIKALTEDTVASITSSCNVPISDYRFQSLASDTRNISQSRLKLRATRIAQRWLDRNFPITSPEPKVGSKRWWMEALKENCIAEMVAKNGSEDDLVKCLDHAEDVVSDLADLRKSINGKAHIPDGEGSTTKLAIGDIQLGRIRLNLTSTTHTESMIEPQERIGTLVCKYLDRPYLQTRALDRLLFDTAIAADIVCFHESRGQTVGSLIERNQELRGARQNWSRISRWTIGVSLLALLGSVFWAIWAVATASAIIFVIASLLYVGASIVYAIKSVSRRRHQVRTINYLDKCSEYMASVWAHLDEPVISPLRVRELMLHAASTGANWRGWSWALIDRLLKN